MEETNLFWRVVLLQGKHVMICAKNITNLSTVGNGPIVFHWSHGVNFKCRSRFQFFIMATQQKRRKIDADNRAFKDEWTDKHAFIFNGKSSQPMCLIWNFSTTVVKKANIKWHFQTNHPTFDREFPPNSEKRTNEIKKLKGSVTAGQQLMGAFLTVQERATIASLNISGGLENKWNHWRMQKL